MDEENREVTRKRWSVHGIVLLLGVMAGILVATRIYVFSELLFFLGLAAVLCLGVATSGFVVLVLRDGLVWCAGRMRRSRQISQQNYWASWLIRQFSSYRSH